MRELEDIKTLKKFIKNQKTLNEDKETVLSIFKLFFMLSGIIIFFVGIITESWLKLTGGFLFILFSLIISN